VHTKETHINPFSQVNKTKALATMSTTGKVVGALDFEDDRTNKGPEGTEEVACESCLYHHVSQLGRGSASFPNLIFEIVLRKAI